MYMSATGTAFGYNWHKSDIPMTSSVGRPKPVRGVHMFTFHKSPKARNLHTKSMTRWLSVHWQTTELLNCNIGSFQFVVQSVANFQNNFKNIYILIITVTDRTFRVLPLLKWLYQLKPRLQDYLQLVSPHIYQHLSISSNTVHNYQHFVLG